MSTPNERTFYAAIGIELPARATLNAAVRCFAQPDAHQRGDRSPSCSVSLASGAWNCHGCGARGGAYDAAIATGHTPRSAMELLIAHGLAQPRSANLPRVIDSPAKRRSLRVPNSLTRAKLAWDEADVRQCAESLDAEGRLGRRLALERAWSLRTIRQLEVGFDGARITIPIRDDAGELRGVLRYDPFGRREPKMRCVAGTRLGLVPHPAREPSDHIVLVEGPPDMIAARSAGLCAIAVPGTHAWQASWAQLLVGRRITIVMDCDAPGRRAADAIAADLAGAARAVEIVDLWPGRYDGYDLTDRILDRRRARPRLSVPRTLASLLLPAQSPHPNPPRAGARRDQEASR